MKRLLAMILAAVLLLCGMTACAEGIDLSGMTQEQLIALIDSARLELVKFMPSAVDGTILYEDENVTITLDGAPETDRFDSLILNVIVENHTDHNMTVALRNASCNGWSIWEASISVPAHKKAREDFDFMNAVKDAELESGEDVQDIEGDITYYDSDSWDDLTDEIHVRWTF